MISYLLKRVVQSLVVLAGVILLTFIGAHVIPGGAARAALRVRGRRPRSSQPLMRTTVTTYPSGISSIATSRVSSFI